MSRLHSIFRLLDEGAEASGGAGLFGMISMIVVLVVVFYFFLYRPQKKQERETAAMRDSIELGDVISTVGGIIGVVVRIKDEMLLIETGADRTRLQVMKWAVRGVEEKAHQTANTEKSGGKAVEKASKKSAEKSADKPKLKK